MFRSDHQKITLHERDWKCLLQLIATADLEAVAKLKAKLVGAKVVPVGLLPSYVITVGSTVTIMDTESCVESTVTLVLPQNADAQNLNISILSTLGSELFGLRTGNIIQWDAPDGGTRQLKIVNVKRCNSRERAP